MMEHCEICEVNYEKSFKSDYLKSVKHFEKWNGNYCKKLWFIHAFFRQKFSSNFR